MWNPLEPKPPPELLERLRDRDGGRVEKMPTLPMLLNESLRGSKRLDCVVLRRNGGGGDSAPAPALDWSLSRRARASVDDAAWVPPVSTLEMSGTSRVF